MKTNTSPRKPVVLLDVDGVLADFCGAVIEHLRGVGVSKDESQITDYDIPKALMLTEEARWHFFSLLEWDGLHSVLKPYSDALEAWEELNSLSEVHVVTKPFARSRSWMFSRLSWLEKHFGLGPDEVTFTARKELVWGDVLVEDDHRNLEKWRNKWKRGKPVLISRPWNESFEARSLRRPDWKSILDTVRDLRR